MLDAIDKFLRLKEKIYILSDKNQIPSHQQKPVAFAA